MCLKRSHSSLYRTFAVYKKQYLICWFYNLHRYLPLISHPVTENHHHLQLHSIQSTNRNVSSKMSALLSLSALFFLILSPTLHAYKVVATGRILCAGRGLPFSKISLMDDDPIIDKRMGSATTSSSGYFTVSGSASDVAIKRSRRKPDVYIRLDLEHSSSKAIFKVTRPITKGKHKSSVKSNRSGNVSFGTLSFSNDACKAYLKFYDATRDFRTRVGYRVPFSLNIRSEAIIHGGTPYALYDNIKLPKGYALSFTTAKHELAHTVRHRYDGSKAHFLFDAGRFLYPRNHHCAKVTNKGFAFNEGWAQFWAGSCKSQSATGSKKVEGNVASALRALQKRCGTSNRNMWEVLRKYPKKIHSYSEYASRHRTRYGC